MPRDPFVDVRDCCLSIFGAVYETDTLVFPPDARVLEVGCAEADWMTPMLAVRPDLQITGIDCRPGGRPGEVIQGDVLTHDWPDASFDVMVGVSSIEHIGLGHYGDPLDPDGDRHCMERVARWLKPGGWVYLDVPYGPAYAVAGTSHRVYDMPAVVSRLMGHGLQLQRAWYATGATVHTPSEAPPAQVGNDLVYVALYATKASVL